MDGLDDNPKVHANATHLMMMIRDFCVISAVAFLIT